MEHFDADTDTTQILKGILEDALPIVRSGGVILYPTDTIWSIGCGAFNEGAVGRIKEIRKATSNEDMILLVDSMDQLKEYVDYIHPRLETLLYYHQRPLTVVYDRTSKLPDYLLNEDGSAAFRITTDPLCIELIRALNSPMVVASANIEGESYPGHFGEISSEIIRAVDHVVKWKQNESESQEPSVIVTINSRGELEFIRN